MHQHFYRENRHERHCVGRSGHGRGGGHRHRDRRGGGGGFRIGRMIGDGDLRLIVLALLAEGPRHGYDIIKALEVHSSGVYSPSPGIVYPTLTFLEEAGYAEAESEGSKRVYTITDAGRAYLDANREHADAILAGIERVGRKMARARAYLEDEDQRPASAKDDRDIPGVIPEVNEARRALKAAIAEKLDAPADEQKRLAAILRDAATAIRKPVGNRKDDIDLG